MRKAHTRHHDLTITTPAGGYNHRFGHITMGNASERRRARVGSLVLRTLAGLMREELADPRVQLCSISSIKLAKDLTSAEVAVVAVGGADASASAVAALNAAAPLLWNRLRETTDLRIVPRLRFVVDHGPEYAQRIEELLLEIPVPASDDPGQEDQD